MNLGLTDFKNYGVEGRLIRACSVGGIVPAAWAVILLVVTSLY